MAKAESMSAVDRAPASVASRGGSSSRWGHHRLPLGGPFTHLSEWHWPKLRMMCFQNVAEPERAQGQLPFVGSKCAVCLAGTR